MPELSIRVQKTRRDDDDSRSEAGSVASVRSRASSAKSNRSNYARDARWFEVLNTGDGGLSEKIWTLQERLANHEEAMRKERQEYLDAIAALRGDLSESRREVKELRKELQKKEDRIAEGSKTYSSAEPRGGESAIYEFNGSMWDAALLCFFQEVSVVDKVVLALGAVINHCLQGTLLLVVLLDMLDNPFTPTTVREMIHWRVQSHSGSQFDSREGLSKTFKLCNQELWTFEQDQYSQMYQYLYKPIPGYVLSVLAIILWVMTTVQEFRITLEQARAILSLEISKPGDPCIMESPEGSLQIVGIRRCSRNLALTMLSLPRLVVVAMLSWVGCQYLARTPSLSDIVLNAVALAFVLDIDELLYNVLSTQKIRTMMDKLQPVPCERLDQRFFVGPVHFQDCIRYVMIVGIVCAASYFYLVPFHDNLQGAANALCGGNYDFSFSYSAGESQVAPIIVQNSTNWVRNCGRSEREQYHSLYYPSVNATNGTLASNDTSFVEAKSTIARVALNYALHGCDYGHILNPIRVDSGMPRTCIPMPTVLRDGLPSEVKLQELKKQSAPRCRTFSADYAAENMCRKPTDGEACEWDWLSQKCESSPSGDYQRDACTVQTRYTQEQLVQTCAVWEAFGRATSPWIHCRAVRACRTSGADGCLLLRGQLNVDVRGDARSFRRRGLAENPNFLSVRLALKPFTENTLHGSELPLADLKIRAVSNFNHVRRLSSDQGPRRLSTSGTSTYWFSGLMGLPEPNGTSRLTLYYSFENLPATFVPDTFFQVNGDFSLFAQSLNASLGMYDIVQVSFENNELMLNSQPSGGGLLAQVR